MLGNTRAVRIEWGDCDPAGIVFYPRYIAIFDACTNALLERAAGMSKYQLLQTYEFADWPPVETRARFLLPTRFGDDLVIESSVTALGRSSFAVHHRLRKQGELAVEGFETRVWTTPDPDHPGRIKSRAIPPEIAVRLRGGE
jgi:4-hydroxybenzoyl-CoA thioesterase